MSKCPYCKEEIEIKLELSPTPIDDKFKADILKAVGSFMEIKAEFAPFGKDRIKKIVKLRLNYLKIYFDQIGAVPQVFHSCSKCDSLITSESLLDFMSLHKSK